MGQKKQMTALPNGVMCRLPSTLMHMAYNQIAEIVERDGQIAYYIRELPWHYWVEGPFCPWSRMALFNIETVELRGEND